MKKKRKNNKSIGKIRAEMKSKKTRRKRRRVL